MFSKYATKFLLGALFATATTLTAAADTVTAKLVNAGNPADIASSVTIDGVTKSNVYIGPYTLSINGTDVLAMCIDFNIESPVGSTYTANETTVGSSDLSKTYGESSKVYEEEAYLYSQIIQTGADRLAIQEAAWDITAYDITGNVGSLAAFFAGINSSTLGYINAAVSNASSMNGQYAIISDVVKGGQQEFIVDPPISSSVTPEPSSFMLMLAPAMAGAEAIRRKRQAASLLS